VEINLEKGKSYRLDIRIPADVTAEVRLPSHGKEHFQLDGREVKTSALLMDRDRGCLRCINVSSGHHVIESISVTQASLPWKKSSP